MLSNWYHAPFLNKYTDLTFYTVEGLIFYLGSNDPWFCTVSGWEAKKEGTKRDRHIRIPNFEKVIKEALREKIEQNPRIKELLKKSALPFDHYYLYNGRIFRPKKWTWIVEEWEIIRRELNEKV
jgi:hypothetical protein